jgi:hypothetical protein
MTRRRVFRVIVGLAALTFGISAPAGSGVASAGAPCSWEIQTSGGVPGQNTFIYGISARASDDVWAVGATYPGQESTFTEHWDGLTWTAVPSPNPHSAPATLLAVAAVSATEAWAVGTRRPNAGSITRNVIEHWTGSQWQVVPSPNRGSLSNALTAVTVVSSTDVWAVGYSSVPGGQRTLVEHWDGTNWSIVPSPNRGGEFNQLLGVSAVSSTDILAVGFRTHNDIARTLGEHWDGVGWTVVPTMNGSSHENRLTAVSAITGDAWAVGFRRPPVNAVYSDLIERWNGSDFTLVTSPLPRTNTFLHAVATVSGTLAWSAGSTGQLPLVEKWNGTAWSVDNSIQYPSGVDSAQFRAVSALSTGEVWAAGFTSDSGVAAPLIEHRC